jgi:hypothetical protein
MVVGRLGEYICTSSAYTALLRTIKLLTCANQIHWLGKGRRNRYYSESAVSFYADRITHIEVAPV